MQSVSCPAWDVGNRSISKRTASQISVIEWDFISPCRCLREVPQYPSRCQQFSGKHIVVPSFFAPALMTRSVTLSPLSRRVFRARCFIVDDMVEKERFTFFIKYHNFAFWPIKWQVSWLKKIDLKTLNVSLDSASDSFIHLSCATKTPLRLLHSYTRRNNNI